MVKTQEYHAMQATPAALSVQTLTLTNFRNHGAFSLEAGPAPVILTGPNGAGKTNILEAVSLLGQGRGIRGARVQELLREGATSWIISARIRSESGETVAIGTGTLEGQESDRRVMKVNGEKIKSQAELGEYFVSASLTPQMDQCLSEGTTSRREWLDQLTGMFFADHIRHQSVYRHAKSERTALLARGINDPVWIGTLERRMAEHGVAIAAARLETIAHLQTAIDASPCAFPKAIIGVEGQTERDLEHKSALETEECLKERLENVRGQDRASGRTSVGPHRSDFTVIHAEKNTHAERCSTGEQKALLLSITLASSRALAAWKGTMPVVLLDEVVAHLDPEKRRQLAEEIQALGSQVWMTGTDPSFFADFQGGATFLAL